MGSTRDFEGEDFASMLEAFEKEQGREPTRRGPQAGETVQGRVVVIGQDKVFVDLGGRAEAALDLADVTDADGNVRVSVGDTVEARVVSVEADGTVTLRRALGRGQEAAAELEQAHAHGIPVEGLVTAAIKGGLEVQVAGLRAFCPISQIDSRFVENAEEYVGQRFEFRITRYEGGRRPNIVLSRRDLLEQEARAQAEETRARLEPGAVFTGKITSLKPYGAFVDLGGLDGLLHVSQLGFERIEHPGEVLSEGQTVEVQVLKVEPSDGAKKRSEKISLSMRSLQEDPWEKSAAGLREGARARGRVTKLESFGAFVEIAPGVEGLVHISEIPSPKPLSHARQAMSVGDTVETRIASVDLERRRISLSIAAAKRAEEAEIVEEARDRQKPPESLGTLGDLLKKSLKDE